VLAPLAARGSYVLQTLTGLAVVGVAIAGLVMFIIRIKRVNLLERPGELSSDHWGEHAFVNVGIILFLVAGIGLFVVNTLASLM